MYQKQRVLYTHLMPELASMEVKLDTAEAPVNTPFAHRCKKLFSKEHKAKKTCIKAAAKASVSCFNQLLNSIIAEFTQLVNDEVCHKELDADIDKYS